jgi:hypothetical protein
MEGRLHQLFKRSVTQELRKEGYIIHTEPWIPPIEQLVWHSYRPDIVDVLANNGILKVTLVECETTPNRTRVLAKTTRIRRTMSLQKRFHEHHEIRLLLTIPPTQLHKINYAKIRRFWEIWIVNRWGTITQRIPRIKGKPP